MCWEASGLALESNGGDELVSVGSRGTRRMAGCDCSS